MIGLALLQQCAPQVAPVTMAAIVQTESSGWPWAIDVNGLPGGGSMRFNDQQAAITAATRYIRMGYKVDMGLAQVDSENLAWLGLSVTNVFNPCANLKAAQRILIGAYRQAGASGTQSLDGAFQAYNSGNTSGDGHYAKVVYRQAGVEVPAIPGGQLAAWASRPVGGVGVVGKEEGAGVGDAPIRPVIIMPPKSWQPLTKGEDFPVTTVRQHGKSQAKEQQRNASPVTAIWTAAR